MNIFGQSDAVPKAFLNSILSSNWNTSTLPLISTSNFVSGTMYGYLLAGGIYCTSNTRTIHRCLIIIAFHKIIAVAQQVTDENSFLQEMFVNLEFNARLWSDRGRSSDLCSIFNKFVLLVAPA